MHFTHNFLGVEINISFFVSPSSPGDEGVGCVVGGAGGAGGATANTFPCLRQSNDRVEVEVSNFTGKIVIFHDSCAGAAEISGNFPIARDIVLSAEEKINDVDKEPEIVVDALPEKSGYIAGACFNIPENVVDRSRHGKCRSLVPTEAVEATGESEENGCIDSIHPMPSHPNNSLDQPRRKAQSTLSERIFISNNSQPNPLNFHQECAKSNPSIHLLRAMLKENPQLASTCDGHGLYPAHILAMNESLICDVALIDQAGEFVSELCYAYPTLFFADDVSEIPFAEYILEWIASYHGQYNVEPIYPVEESESRSFHLHSKVLTTHLQQRLSSTSVEEDIKSLRMLPQISSTPKLVFSVKILSSILDNIVRSSYESAHQVNDVSGDLMQGRESLIRNLASIPYLIRTILLIEDAEERYELLHSSIIQNILFCEKSVGHWMIAMICGNRYARESLVWYFRLVSEVSLPNLLGIERRWNSKDLDLFRSSQRALYDEIGSVNMIVPTLLRLGDDLLYEAAPTKVVVHLINDILGQPISITIALIDAILQLALIATYRAILKLNISPSISNYPKEFKDLWLLAVSIVSGFIFRDLLSVVSAAVFSRYVILGYAKKLAHHTKWVASVSLLSLLAILYGDHDFYSPNWMAMTMGLLWLKFLWHIKSMNENVAMLIYIIFRILRKILPFLIVTLLIMFMFGDMMEIIAKASGDCATISGLDEDNDFCASRTLDSYFFMYTVLISGLEFSTLYYASPIIRIILVVYTFIGIIILLK